MSQILLGYLLIAIPVIGIFIIGIIQGIWMERSAWNKLIKQGKIPSPLSYHHWSKDIVEGKVQKGRINEPPTTPRPPTGMGGGIPA